MTDVRKTKSELSKLRDEIPRLEGLPPLSPEFLQWLERLITLVKDAFGSDSEELKRVRAINVELPSEFYDTIEKKLESLPLNETSKRQLFSKLRENSPVDIFKQRLFEYDDLIASFLMALRCS